MALSMLVAKMRAEYHMDMVELVNVGNQLGIIKDEKAEEYNKHHIMTLIKDVFPRIYGEEAVAKLLEEQRS